ncbi:MAG: peptidylprolyl isomerase [Bacteroidota bacterium]|nr:peptidylprolyl isomerase [Bacteroidota bacterium]
MKKLLYFIPVCLVIYSFANQQPSKVSKNQTKPKIDTTYMVLMKTTMGDITLKLYNETPKHRDNFIDLVKKNFFDSLLFHRVINNFMIQGGDPNSKNAQAGAMLGDGDVGYTVPAEFNTKLIHKKGVLAAARNDNPEKASSGCQFYIVQGKKTDSLTLNMLEKRNGLQYTAEQRKIYQTIGGTPFLDNSYTVYGETISGIEVVDRIAVVPGDGSNRPNTNIYILSTKLIITTAKVK